MPKFNNRLSTGTCCNKPSTEREISTPLIPEDKPVPKTETVPTIVTGSKCWTVKIKHITKIGDKVLVMFDDCSFIEAEENVLDSNICKLSDDDVKEKVNEIAKKLDNLVEVEDLNGKPSFMAFPVEN